MFGFVVASLGQVTDEEKERYHALYCGLCRALKERYGQLSRAVLSYDLTFYILMASSLNDDPEKQGSAHCIMHPRKKMAYAQSVWTDYAADLAVALAYHKCLDDVSDDGTLKSRVAARTLKDAYEQAQRRIPDQCACIEAAMATIRDIETNLDVDVDAAAWVFGCMLGELFAHEQGIWSDTMSRFGTELGRFIYFMDAAVDYADDAASGSYNPFVSLQASPENMKTLLAVLIGDAASTFEKLPLENDLHLMRSVLYAGVWQKFNETYLSEDRADVDENVSEGLPQAAEQTADDALFGGQSIEQKGRHERESL